MWSDMATGSGPHCPQETPPNIIDFVHAHSHPHTHVGSVTRTHTLPGSPRDLSNEQGSQPCQSRNLLSSRWPWSCLLLGV